MDKVLITILEQIKKLEGENQFTEQIYENEIIFISDEIAYSIFYENNTIYLRCCKAINGNIDKNWQNLSQWLFDSNINTKADALSIANDFAQTMFGNKSKNKKGKIVKQKNNSDDGVNPMFLINRFASIFPSLREDMKYEKEYYDSFRHVTFIKEKVLPCINDSLNSAKEDVIKKLCNIINDMYIQGDFDVQSIITVVILNSIYENKNKDLIEKNLNEEIIKAWKMSLKFKNSNIKPEKKKKVSNILSKTLNS